MLLNKLITPFLNKEFYPSKKEKLPKLPINYFYQVKYVLKNEGGKQVAKGVTYVRETPKLPSRRDVRRGNI